MRAKLGFLMALSAFGFVLGGCLWPHLIVIWFWRLTTAMPIDRYRSRVAYWQTWWGDCAFRAVCAIMGIRVEWRLPEVDAREPAIIMSNHQSALDILVVAAAAARTKRANMRWILKSQMASKPVIGWAARQSGCAFVSRDRDPADYERVAALAARASGDKASVLFFPEGTRFKTPVPDSGLRHVLPPKRAGFNILRESLPTYPVLSITLRWDPPVSGTSGRTIFQGADFYGKRLHITVDLIAASAVRADPDWLEKEWRRKDALLDADGPHPG